MSKEEVPLQVKVANIICNHLELASSEIRALLKQQMPSEFKEPQPIAMRQHFPKELEELLNFEVQGEWIKVSPKQYLGSEAFARINAIVRELKGSYVSDGKNSHFRIPNV